MSYRNGCVGLIIISMILIYSWGFLNNPTTGIVRFYPTGLNTHFLAKKYSSFDDYIHQTSMMVRKAHEKTHYHMNKIDVFNNSPKILVPDSKRCPLNQSHQYEKGIILIHGLFDSPYGMAQLGQFFQRHCFLVYIPLLPGHGTVVGDLLAVNYHDWIDIINFSTIELAKKVKHVYLGGHSIGGLLAINQALKATIDIKGLILLAPALAMKTQLTPWKNILSMSHLSLTLQMNDPIYGIKGEYKDCLYYKENSIPWKQCKSGMNTKLGEVTSQNIKIAVIQRLTFNPFYTTMLDKLTDFFVSIDA